MPKGHKLQINTDYVEGYCVKFFKACQSAPLSSLLCCAILLLVVVTILVWLIAAFAQLIEFDDDDEDEAKITNSSCDRALEDIDLSWPWWLRVAGTLFTVMVFAVIVCGCLMFTVSIDFCPSRILQLMYCCMVFPIGTFVFFFIWLGVGTYMVDQLYKADGDRSHHCKLGKNSTTYLGLMYCYLFALLILTIIYIIYKMAFKFGKRSRKK